MLIVWQGGGFLVPLIVLLVGLLINWSVDTYIRLGYWNSHSWPFALTAVIAGILCRLFGIWSDDQPGREVIDAKSGQCYDLKQPDTFVFIPVRIWGFLLMGLGVLFLVFSCTPGPG